MEHSDLAAAGDGLAATPDPERRRTLAWLSRLGMAAGLTAAYGTFAALLARFAYPARPPATGWMFVTQPEKIAAGSALLYRTPSGATVNIARQGDGNQAEDFVALSSTCPHLGCQVHWEPQNNRFFCPCHNGVFDPGGKAIGGPPGDAGQALSHYALKVEKGLLYIEVPFDEVAEGPGEVLAAPALYGPGSGPGHDPCLCSSQLRKA